ncbi:MAG: hypothetical protein HOV76_32390 [Hamadaea sp.]|nr:hypothetical protein [Catenulispora sp.]NUT08177.1 hypothetical protein [Hamadaea sp.]
MPTLPLSTRFFQPGIVKVYWLPAVAATSPTRAEITAGTNLTPELDDWSGWSYSTTFIETKDASSRVSPKLAGRVSLDDSSMTFNGSQNGLDIRTVLTINTSGFVLICDGGDVPTQPAELFPSTVGAVVPVRSLDSDAFKVRIDFGVTNLPRTVTLPA